LLFSSSFAKDLKLELDEILAQEYEDITYGFTQAADDVVIFRALGNNGELLYDFLLMLGQLCWEFSQHKISEKNQVFTEQEKLKNKGNVDFTSINEETPKEIQSVKVKKAKIKQTKNKEI